MLLRQVLGVCPIRIFAKNMGDPYYEPTIMVHDKVASHSQTLLFLSCGGGKEKGLVNIA